WSIYARVGFAIIKHMKDEIGHVLAVPDGFTVAELDFIINYDTRLRCAGARHVEYRPGRENEEAAE
ncbi:MAG TPA: hypothetical protein VKA67_05065, partial [Verrucomicrobiae bacterium]|nr:hypothetical protein [Verrucomicrobiae bacterium]